MWREHETSSLSISQEYHKSSLAVFTWSTIELFNLFLLSKLILCSLTSAPKFTLLLYLNLFPLFSSFILFSVSNFHYFFEHFFHLFSFTFCVFPSLLFLPLSPSFFFFFDFSALLYLSSCCHLHFSFPLSPLHSTLALFISYLSLSASVHCLLLSNLHSLFLGLPLTVFSFFWLFLFHLPSQTFLPNSMCSCVRFLAVLSANVLVYLFIFSYFSLFFFFSVFLPCCCSFSTLSLLYLSLSLSLSLINTPPALLLCLYTQSSILFFVKEN